MAAAVLEGNVPSSMMDEGAYSTPRQRDVVPLSDDLLDEVRRLTATLSAHELVQFARELLCGTQRACGEELLLDYSAQVLSDMQESNTTTAARRGSYEKTRMVIDYAQQSMEETSFEHSDIASRLEVALLMENDEISEVQWAKKFMEYASQQGIKIDLAETDMDKLEGALFVLHGTAPSRVLDFVRTHYGEVAITHETDLMYALLVSAMSDDNLLHAVLAKTPQDTLGRVLRDVCGVMLGHITHDAEGIAAEALRLVLSDTLLNHRMPSRIKESLRRTLSRVR